MENKISYKRYLNKGFLKENSNDFFIERLFGDKEHFWTTTGRNGLATLFKLLQLKKGDKILVPAFVAHGIILPIKRLGLDIEYYKSEKNLVPNYQDLSKKLKDPRVKIVIVIHYFGYPQDVDAIFQLATQHNVTSIEDCAQALFSSYPDGKPIGTKGDITLYSLTKFLPIPDGSLFVINNAKFNYLKRELRFERSVISYLSVLMARFQLKISFWQSNFQIKGILFPLTLIYKIVTLIHYWLICLEKKPVTISNYSYLLLKRLDIESIIKKRKSNLQYFENALSKKNYIHYREYSKDFCLTGFPIITKNRAQMLKELGKRGIRCLVYNKLWWFIPDNRKDMFKDEYSLYCSHMLLPVNENIDMKSMDQIIESLNELSPIR